MILEVRYYNLEDFSINKVHADKWLGYERIEKLEKIREKKQKKNRKNLYNSACSIWCKKVTFVESRRYLSGLCIAERMPNMRIEAEKTGQLKFA